MAEEVARREPSPQQQLVAQVRRPDFQEQIALALPEGMPPARFVRVAATAVLETPELVEATPDSIFNALLKSAADGLLPDGREAALVVGKNKKTNKKEAQYRPMIGGFRKIAAEHGWALEARVVYAEDSFAYVLGDEPKVTHEPAPLGQERGKIVAAYAVGRELRTGARMIEVMTAEDVAKARAKAATQAVWNEWEAAMTEKTVGRRLFKRLPLGDRDRVRSVLAADELEHGEATDLAYGSPRADRESADAAEAPEASSASEGEPGSEAASSPAPFTGEEPPPEEPEPDEALEAARAVVVTFGRLEGKTLGEVAEAGERGWLRWASSDAVQDEELRAAAAKVLEATS